MHRYLTKQNAVMVGCYLLFLFLRGFVSAIFAGASYETMGALIQGTTIAEYLLVAFIGAYGAAATQTLRGGMVIVFAVKLLSELLAIFRMIIRLAGPFSDFLPFALGRTATVTGIALLAALVTSTIVKARANRE